MSITITKDNQIYFDLLKLLNKHHLLDNFTEKEIKYEIDKTDFDIYLTIKPKATKEKSINSISEKEQNISVQNHNDSTMDESIEANYSSNESMNEESKKFLKNYQPLFKQIDSINNSNIKKSKTSEKIVKKRKNEKFSKSLEKIKEVEEKLPKGLYNLGLSCYMNSLLQCLFYIKELREYFIEKIDTFNEDQKMCQAFAKVMYGLKNDEEENIEPKEFKNLIGEANSLFLGRKAADVKDLLFNLIDSFLTELNQEDDDIENENEDSATLDFSNKEQMFKETKKEIDQNYNIINELFIGYYYTMYKCLETQTSTYSFQTESFILFDLEKIKNYFGKNDLSLDLCFEYYYRKQSNSSFYCNKCKKTHKGEAYEKMYRPPKILIVILDRGHGKTFKGEVKINKNLELKTIIDEDNYEYSSLYKLICVSTHSGSSSSSGHYTACCLTDNNKYYYFSDTYVKEINEENIIKDEPYLLFYQQIEDNNEENNEINIEKEENQINRTVNIEILSSNNNEN